jgi:hypothetical protein
MLKVYITDLSAYNQGRLIGKWVDLPASIDELEYEVDEILKKGADCTEENTHEEYFLTDWEWNYEEVLDLHEYSNIYELNESLRDIEDLDEYEMDKILFLKSVIGLDLEDALDSKDDVTYYEGMNMIEVVDDMLDNGLFGDIPESIKWYIDTNRIARDLEMDGYYEDSKGTFYYR